jgi:hypothetical protein
VDPANALEIPSIGEDRRIGMLIKRTLAITMAAFLFLFLFQLQSFAGERSRSGSYKGRRTSGTWQQQTHRSRGHVERNTTWQNGRGQGSRASERNWSRETGTGSYSSTTNRANGRTSSRQGTVTKTGDGSCTLDGTRTTAKGKVIDVEKTFTKNPDGSRSLHSVYTGPEGQTRTVDSSLQKTDTGRSVTGTYSSSGGKSGSFESNLTHTESGVVKDQSRTHQDGETWQRNIHRNREGNTINRDVTVTDPQGATRSYTQSVELDEPAADDGSR